MFNKILIQIGLKLLFWGAYKILPQANIVPDKVITFAQIFCDKYEAVTDVSGEWKRHQAYSALIKKFPLVKKRVLALAIELEINKRAD